MVIADHNFRRHVNVLIYMVLGAERSLLFEGDGSMEGSRCLVLLNVCDVSVVTRFRVVYKMNFM